MRGRAHPTPKRTASDRSRDLLLWAHGCRPEMLDAPADEIARRYGLTRDEAAAGVYAARNARGLL